MAITYPAPEAHQHTLFVIRMGDPGGGWRWACSTCGTVGGPPRATSAESWEEVLRMRRIRARWQRRAADLRGTGLL